ncbi:hypothetical protein CR513_18895, partial [Mucuna pruriens]
MSINPNACAFYSSCRNFWDHAPLYIVAMQNLTTKSHMSHVFAAIAAALIAIDYSGQYYKATGVLPKGNGTSSQVPLA